MKTITSSVSNKALTGAVSKVAVIVMTGCFATGSSQGATTANLLVDPGFESNALAGFSTVLSDFTNQNGKWGVEVGSIVIGTSGDGVSPIGTRMLGMQDDGATSTQAVQVTDISSIAGSGDGTATFDMSAAFTMGGGPLGGFAGGRVAVIAMFFSGSSYGSLTGSTSISLDLNSDEKFEPLALQGTIPAGTTWMVTQVLYSDSSIGTHTGYVDDASFTITTVPEPGAWSMLGLGALGMMARRRRH